MKEKQVILVVDDQPPNIALLEAHLIPQGYEVVKAESGGLRRRLRNPHHVHRGRLTALSTHSTWTLIPAMPVLTHPVEGVQVAH